MTAACQWIKPGTHHAFGRRQNRKKQQHGFHSHKKRLMDQSDVSIISGNMQSKSSSSAFKVGNAAHANSQQRKPIVLVLLFSYQFLQLRSLVRFGFTKKFSMSDAVDAAESALALVSSSPGWW